MLARLSKSSQKFYLLIVWLVYIEVNGFVYCIKANVCRAESLCYRWNWQRDMFTRIYESAISLNRCQRRMKISDNVVYSKLGWRYLK